MGLVAQIATALNALILIAVFPAEAFLIHKPAVQKFLGIEPYGIENVHLWSFCIGARNALGGVGALIGLWMVNFGNPVTGTTVVVVALIYALGASLFMGIADLLGFWRPRGGSIKGTISSAVLPIVALVALGVAG